MPKAIPADVALRERLKGAVTESLSLNDRLEAVIAVKSRIPGGFHGKIDFSQPPWNAQAAHVVLDLHAWARDAERMVRYRLSLPARDRGGSAGNTKRALQRLCGHSEVLDDGLVTDHVRWLDGWGRRALTVLGEREPVRRLPRVPGEPSWLCPWCGRDSLRQLPAQALIWCVSPSCRDEEGRRPKGRLEPFGGELVLRWMDGVISGAAA